MKKHEQRELLFATMDAANEIHNDAPDGAWQAALEGTVEFFNERHGTSFDPNDMFIEWCKRQCPKIVNN